MPRPARRPVPISRSQAAGRRRPAYSDDEATEDRDPGDRGHEHAAAAQPYIDRVSACWRVPVPVRGERGVDLLAKRDDGHERRNERAVAALGLFHVGERLLAVLTGLEMGHCLGLLDAAQLSVEVGREERQISLAHLGELRAVDLDESELVTQALTRTEDELSHGVLFSPTRSPISA